MSKKHGASVQVRKAMAAEESLCEYMDRKVEAVRKAARQMAGKRIYYRPVVKGGCNGN